EIVAVLQLADYALCRVAHQVDLLLAETAMDLPIHRARGVDDQAKLHGGALLNSQVGLNRECRIIYRGRPNRQLWVTGSDLNSRRHMLASLSQQSCSVSVSAYPAWSPMVGRRPSTLAQDHAN